MEGSRVEIMFHRNDIVIEFADIKSSNIPKYLIKYLLKELQNAHDFADRYDFVKDLSNRFDSAVRSFKKDIL